MLNCDICGRLKNVGLCHGCIDRARALNEGEIFVKTSKIEAVIEFINNKNSQGCFEYAVYSEIFNMIEDLKK